MMHFNKSDLLALSSKLKSIERREVAEVTRLALNDMAFAVHKDNKRLMAEVFDRPNPFTLNAFFVRKATHANLVATVERKTMASGRHYLEVQHDGGPRGKTGVERLLTQRLKYEGIIQAVLPTKALRKNRYGNVSAGRLQQIVSGIKAQSDRHQNTTAASRKRAAGKRAEYFVPSIESKLSPGVYQRRAKSVRKMLSFSQSVPSYSKRFPMEANAHEVASDVAAQSFSRAFARTMGQG